MSSEETRSISINTCLKCRGRVLLAVVQPCGRHDVVFQPFLHLRDIGRVRERCPRQSRAASHVKPSGVLLRTDETRTGGVECPAGEGGVLLDRTLRVVYGDEADLVAQR